jgi:hypothetical protein
MDTGGIRGSLGALSLTSFKLTVSVRGALAALPVFSLATTYNKRQL